MADIAKINGNNLKDATARTDIANLKSGTVAAGKATKLATPRTITLGTAATGSVNFDGSANVTLPVTGVKEAYLQWGGRNINGGISPIDAAASSLHSANRLQFAKPAGITIEYSNDGGTTWIDYGIADFEKIQLVSGIGKSVAIGKKSSNITTSDQLRITLNATNMVVYTQAVKFLINLSTNGAGGCKVKFEKAHKGSESVFSTVGTYDISGWSGWNSIPVNNAFGGGTYQTGNVAIFRFTFSIGSLSSTYNNALSVSDIVLLGSTYWEYPSNMAKTGHLYSWDYLQNATFPAKVKANGGFEGSLSGNASTASKATNDKNGLDITNYIKGLSVSGRTITYTKGDGTTGTITTQDNDADTNTTYTLGKSGSTITLTGSDGSTTSVTDADTNTTYKAGVGLQLSGGTFNLTAATSTTLGGIKTGFTTNGSSYAVMVNVNGAAYVNVPWVNTTYTAGEGLELSGTTFNLASASSESAGGIKLGYTTNANARLYAVNIDSEGRAYVSVPWTDTNTHYTSYLYAGASGTQTNGTTTNGNTYLKLVESDIIRSSRLIKGTGATTVTSNSSGNITINTPGYSLPAATSATLGGIKTGYSSTDNYRAVQLDSSNNGYVYIPAGSTSQAGLISATDKTYLNKAMRVSGAYMYANATSGNGSSYQGYYDFINSDGKRLKLVWGFTAASSGKMTVSFRSAFPNACIGVWMSLYNTNTDNSLPGYKITARSSTSFTAYCMYRQLNGQGWESQPWFWIAIGY